MTLLALSVAVEAPEAVDAALARAGTAAEQGAQLVEWRVDLLPGMEGGLDAAMRLVEASPLPSIITCRPTWEGGLFDGEEAERLNLVRVLMDAAHPPRYVDIELQAWERERHWRAMFPPSDNGEVRDRARLVLSAHDFDARPRDLLQAIARMAAEPSCAAIKVAWFARSLRDNLEAFELLRARHKPMIALCMGPFGQVSRILAPKFGGLLTFASDQPGEETAAGQLTLGELSTTYRFHSISERTRVYGVIGWPVEHSRGPMTHNSAFAAAGFDGVYLRLPVPPEYEHFKATVGAMIDAAHLDFRGASVTLPHKEHLMRFVEERGGRIDDAARLAGAGNTLIVGSAGGLECRNTDSPAAVEALCAAMAIETGALREKRIAILGAGGVARAIVGGLMPLACEIVIFNRNPDRASELVVWFTSQPGDEQTSTIRAGEMSELSDGPFDVHINCTPLGMAGGPAPDESPLPDDAPLGGACTVFDTVYEPQRTALIQQAEARGARVVTGLDMFARQAARQFEAWTGQAMARL